MKHLTLFLGDSEMDISVKQMLQTWSTHNSHIALGCQSIHENPADAVRLGISDLPALVFEDEILAQGALEKWVLPLLDRVFPR